MSYIPPRWVCQCNEQCEISGSECLLHQVEAVSSALRKLDSERGGVERINSPNGYVSSNEAEARWN
jgi:hypothetical protein